MWFRAIAQTEKASYCSHASLMSDTATSSSNAPARRKGRLTHRGAARRQQILDEACVRFLQDGYAGVSVDEIVKQVGGSKTNVYRQFGGKQGLFLAVVQTLSAQFLRDLDQIDLRDQPPEQGLKILAHALLSILLQEQHLAFQRLIVAEAARFPEMGRTWLESGPQQSRRIIARYLQSQQTQGRIRPIDPLRAALFFHDMITFNPVHLAMLGMGYGPSELNRFIEDAVSAFLQGHQTRP